MNYFLFFAAVWGLSAGVAFSKLTAPVVSGIEARSGFLGTLLSCPMCIGFHAGWISVAVGIAPGPQTPLHALTLAFACAGINLIGAVVVERLGGHS